MIPPRHSLTWEEVLKFTFLSDFNLLHDPEGNAAIQPWVIPAACTYFKIKHTKEGIEWLNMEIHCFVTYVRDEKMFLIQKEAEVHETDPHLAFFVQRYRMQRGWFDNGYIKKLRVFVAKVGSQFTGTLIPGVRHKEPEQVVEPMGVDGTDSVEAQKPAVEVERGHRAVENDEDNDEGWLTDDSEDEGEEMEVQVLAETMETVMVLATDKEE